MQTVVAWAYLNVGVKAARQYYRGERVVEEEGISPAKIQELKLALTQTTDALKEYVLDKLKRIVKGVEITVEVDPKVEDRYYGSGIAIRAEIASWRIMMKNEQLGEIVRDFFTDCQNSVLRGFEIRIIAGSGIDKATVVTGNNIAS